MKSQGQLKINLIFVLVLIYPWLNQFLIPIAEYIPGKEYILLCDGIETKLEEEEFLELFIVLFRAYVTGTIKSSLTLWAASVS